jgi:Recombination endonuclease VII
MKKGQPQTDESKQRLREARAKQIHPRFVARGITREMIADAESNGLKWCSGKCKRFIPAVEFGDKESKCRNCKNVFNKRWRDNLTDDQRTDLANHTWNWRSNNSASTRRTTLAKYGVTPEWYDAQLFKQGGHCALCPETKAPHRNFLFVDHNHTTGEVRGLLCYRCNMYLAALEVPGWMDAACGYISSPPARGTLPAPIRSGSRISVTETTSVPFPEQTPHQDM